MITLFCVLFIIAFLVGIVKVFVWMISAAFHLVPFLFGVVMVIGVIMAAVYLLGIIGAVAAVIVIIAACAGAWHHA
jgi:hypothetical protein